MFFAVKVIVSALVIAIVTEIARKFPVYGGVIAALPLVSLLSLFWLSIQGQHSLQLSKFAIGVLWGFPATAILLLIVAFSLKHSQPLFISILLGAGGWYLFLTLQKWLVNHFYHLL